MQKRRPFQLKALEVKLKKRCLVMEQHILSMVGIQKGEWLMSAEGDELSRKFRCALSDGSTVTLERKSQLKATPEKARAWQQQSRKILPRRSKKRIQQDKERAVVMKEVRRRDQTCQLAPFIQTPCFGALHGHEVLKRSRGGSITDPSNILLSCDGHNGWVETNPIEAELLGISLASNYQNQQTKGITKK